MPQESVSAAGVRGAPPRHGERRRPVNNPYSHLPGELAARGVLSGNGVVSRAASRPRRPQASWRWRCWSSSPPCRAHAVDERHMVPPPALPRAHSAAPTVACSARVRCGAAPPCRRHVVLRQHPPAAQKPPVPVLPPPHPPRNCNDGAGGGRILPD